MTYSLFFPSLPPPPPPPPPTSDACAKHLTLAAQPPILTAKRPALAAKHLTLAAQPPILTAKRPALAAKHLTLAAQRPIFTANTYCETSRAYGETPDVCRQAPNDIKAPLILI